MKYKYNLFTPTTTNTNTPTPKIHNQNSHPKSTPKILTEHPAQAGGPN